MAIRFKSRLKPTSSLIDLTPLVDVIFLLLVFFIFTSDILPLKSLSVENPPLERKSSPLTTQVLLVMDAQQVLYLGHQKEIIDLGSLSESLQTEIARVKSEHRGADPSIVLSIDRRVDYGAFLRVFSVAQECAARVRLVYKDAEA